MRRRAYVLSSIILLSITLLPALSIGLAKHPGWHFVGSFTLQYDYWTAQGADSPIFYVPGDMWRINWNMTSPTLGVYDVLGFVVLDGNGNILDRFDVPDRMVSISHANGTFYQFEGNGIFYIEQRGIVSPVDYMIESYY